MDQNRELTKRILSACHDVHGKLGTRLAREIYLKALKIELTNSELPHESEKAYPVIYSDQEVGQVVVDFIIEDQVLLMILVYDEIQRSDYSFIRTLLSISGIDVGLMANFGRSRLEIRRVEQSRENPE